MKKLDPGVGLDRKEAKEIRIKEWKRESKKTDRKKAKEDRIKVWEEETGLKWEY